MFVDMPREGWEKVISVLQEKEEYLKKKICDFYGCTLSNDDKEELQKCFVEFSITTMIRQEIAAWISPKEEKSK